MSDAGLLSSMPVLPYDQPCKRTDDRILLYFLLAISDLVQLIRARVRAIFLRASSFVSLEIARSPVTLIPAIKRS
jgi:hypothetical protein